MQRAYEGYFEDGRFIPFGKVKIPERRKVRVTILDETISYDTGKCSQTSTLENSKFFEEFEHLTEEAKKEDQELRIAWLKKLNAAISVSLDEELPDIPRSTVNRRKVYI